MRLWTRASRPVKVTGAVAIGALLVVLSVPIAGAEEDEPTLADSVDDTTSDDGTSAGLLDPGTSDEDDAVRAPEPVESGTDSTTEAVSGTLDEVDETDEGGTLEPVTGTVRDVVAPEDTQAAEDEPTKPAGDGGATDGGATDNSAQTDDGAQAETQPDPEPTAEPQPEGPLAAQPAAATGRRSPFTPGTLDALGGGELTVGPDGSGPGIPAQIQQIEGPLWDDDGYATAQPSPFLLDTFQTETVVPLGPRSTTDIIDSLGAAAAFPGSLARVLAPFPVAGPASYSDDFGAPRHDPAPHPHAGTDIFAPRGTPVIASAAGAICDLAPDTAIGGNALKLCTADGTYFYYAHLDGFAPGVASGVKVELGQALGYVGDTGNAQGTPPHLHYEIHPQGGEAVNPVRFLDRWLANARASAQSLASAQQGVWTPQVAPPASGSTGGANPAAAPDAQQAQAAPAQPDPNLTGSENDTSPLSVLVLIGAGLVLLAMLRRPRTTPLAPAGPAAAGATSGAGSPPAPVALLPLPGDPEPDGDDDDFELLTLGA